tara:strand:- start:4362 stop:5582 length:1221 start_codon:yes stop_codon:yes gene_type:complete
MTRRERAEAMTPSGSHTMSKRPASYPIDGERFASRGDGAHVTATDGRRYLDFVCSLGATTLGYSHPVITEAVIAQVKAGSLFSFPHRLEVDLAERLCEVIPCAENIRFVKTGSEACAAAASISRSYTGRDVILCEDVGYHGWHDGFRVLANSHPGVPDGMRQFVRMFTYGDLNSLAQMLDGDVAAVMIEPARLSSPPDGFLEAVRDMAHRAGALLIFDEMILGGRHALAGGQEFFSVTPDMATFGKAFGAGYPFAFVAGSANVMQHAWPISGTYSGDAVGLAACSAMLRVYDDDDVIHTIRRNGRMLWDRLLGTGIVSLHGYYPHFQMRLLRHDQRIGMSYFVQECAAVNLLFHPQIVNISGVMDSTDMDFASSIAADVLGNMKGMGDNDLSESLRSGLYEESVRR